MRGSKLKAFAGLAAAALLFADAAAAQQAMDPVNRTCPREPNWSSFPQMRFTLEEIDGKQVLLAEGRVDDNAVPRLQAAFDAHPVIDEIWVRSPGGSASVGNQLGRLIRQTAVPTRIPQGWACFSACNFVFMGGAIRYVDPGGLFIVHMFTHTNDREAIRSEVSRGVDNTIGLIGDIEQQSALLASEDNDFLIRMGISRLLLTEVMYRTSAVAQQSGDRSTRRCLTQDEVHRYNVANAR
jgi:hypothetical protein